MFIPCSVPSRTVLLLVCLSLLLAACDAEQSASTPTVQVAATPAIIPISTPPLPALEIINRSEQAYYVSLPLSGVSSAVLTMTTGSSGGTAEAGTTRYVTFYQAPNKWREEYGDGIEIRDGSGSYAINGGASRGGSMLMLLFGTDFVGMGDCYKLGRAVVEGSGQLFGQNTWVLRVPSTDECRQQKSLGDALIWVDQRTYIDLRVQIQATSGAATEGGDLYTTQVEYDVPLDPALFAKPTATPTTAPTPVPTAVTTPSAGLTGQKVLERSNAVFDNAAVGESNSAAHPDVPLLTADIYSLAFSETIQSRAADQADDQQAPLTTIKHYFRYKGPSWWRSEYSTGELFIAQGNEVSYRDRSGTVTRDFIYSGDNDLFKPFAEQDMAYYFAYPRNCYSDPVLVGSDHIAGRATWVIEVAANDACTGSGERKYYSSRLWVDQQTYLALKLEERQQDGSLHLSREVNDVEYNKPSADGSPFDLVEPSPTASPTPLPGATTNPTPSRSPAQLLYHSSTIFRWNSNTKRGVNVPLTTLMMTTTIENMGLPKGFGQAGTVRQRVWYQAPSQWRSETEADGKTTVAVNDASREGEPAPYDISNLASRVGLPSDSTCYNPPVVQVGEPVLGRTTWQLEMVSKGQCQVKDVYHPADRLTFWIDQATLITLKTEWRNNDGKIVYRGQVEGIELDVPLDPTIFTTGQP